MQTSLPLAQQAFQLGYQAVVSLHVVFFVIEGRPPSGADRDAVAGIWQVFRSQPEIDGVLAHLVEHGYRDKGRRTRLEHGAIKLADHRDVSHGELPVLVSV